jgi:hypothetical protein
MERFIKLYNGEVINHGDIVFATLMENDEPVDVIGRLCINEVDLVGRPYYICQDHCDGDSAAEDKFGHRYSWSFILKDGEIATSDTKYISIYPQQEPEEIVDGGDYKTFNEAPYGDVDDDPMPDDWSPEEKLPQDL